jgi:hypothetical protein
VAECRLFFHGTNGELCCFTPSDADDWYADGTLNASDGTAFQEVLSRTKDGRWICWLDDCEPVDQSLIDARILTDLEALCWFLEKGIPTPEYLEQTVHALLKSQKPDINTAEEIRRRRLAGLPTTIVCAYALRDLYAISYDYPSAFSATELVSLRNRLWSYFWNHLKVAGVEGVTERIYCPLTGTKEGESTTALYAGGLLTIHPDAAIQPSGEMSNASEILTASLTGAPQAVRDSVERIHEIAFSVCRWPDQPNESTFASESRKLELGYRYWRLIARIVGIEASPNRLVGWRPHPLLPTIENLRLRIKVCMQPLDEDPETADIRARIESLLDAVLTDPDGLDMDEFVSRELSDVEGYFVRARLQGRLTTHPLTRAEVIFFQIAESALDKFQADVDAAQVDFKKRIEATAVKRREQSASTKPENSGPKTTPRIVVDVNRETITLDGKKWAVSSQQALRWVKVLAKHSGEWISSKELKNFDAELDGFEPHKSREKLPAEINSLIESRTGAGSRLVLP